MIKVHVVQVLYVHRFRHGGCWVGADGGGIVVSWGAEQPWEQRLLFSSDSCIWGNIADVLREVTQMQETGHVRGPVRSCMLTFVSSARRGWTGLWKEVQLSWNTPCDCVLHSDSVTEMDGVEPAGEGESEHTLNEGVVECL